MGKDFIVFSQDFMYINYNGAKFSIPKYIEKAFKRYRYYNEEGLIKKQCTDCLRWFDVMKVIDSTLMDCHDENEIHLMKGISGFDVRCVDCNNKKKEIIVEQKKLKEKNVKCSLYLKASNKQYLELAAKLQNKCIAELLNEIIEKEKEKNPIELLAKRMYEKLSKK